MCKSENGCCGRGLRTTRFRAIRRRRCYNAQNLPAQEKTETEGAWVQKENEDCGRQKRSQETPREGQKETVLLSLIESYRNESTPQESVASGIAPSVCRLQEPPMTPMALAFRHRGFLCITRERIPTERDNTTEKRGKYARISLSP